MSLYSSGGGGGFRTQTNITQIHQQNLNQEIILGANPWLADDPETLFQLATSGADPEELAHNAGAMAGMDAIDRLQGSLGRLTPTAQRSVYGKLTEQQQRALNQMGYSPPDDVSKGFLDGTLLEGSWDLAGKGAGILMKPVSTIATPAIGFGMDILTWVGDVPAHFYRAIRQMEGWQQWLALGAAVGAVALTGGLALGAGAGLIASGGLMGAAAGGAAGLLGGAAGMGTLATLGTLGGIGLGAATLATAPSAIQNPTEWWDLMNPFGAHGVGRGEKIFSRQGQNKARSILGNAEHLHALARDISAEIDVTDLAFDLAGERDATKQNVLLSGMEKAARKLADPGTQEYQIIFEGLSKLALQPEFLNAVDELQQSKISPGRDLAQAFGMEEGDYGYGLVSGAADALWLFAMDPTLAAGKIGKVQRMIRRGVETPSGPAAIEALTRMVNEDPAVAATVKQVTQAVMNDRFSEMPRAWRSLYQPLVEYRHGEYLQHGLPALENFGAEEFIKFIEHGDGLKRITEGKATIRGIEQIVISTQNSSRGWGKFVEEAKHFKHGFGDAALEDDLYRTAKKFGVEADLEKTLPQRFAREPIDAGFVTRGLDQVAINSTSTYKAGKAIGNGLLYLPGGRSLENFVTGITTMTPPGSAIALTGEDAADHIPRFVESLGTHFNMPSDFRKEWLDTIMMQGTIGQRRQAMYSYLDSVLTAGGMRNSAKLEKFADDFLMKYKQAYSYGGLDDITVGANKRIVGLLPEHHNAVYMVMPNLREMSKIVRQGHIVSNIAKVTDHNFAEQLMSRVIKPGWLLRIGFIPRAAGEEMLAFWLRMSNGGLIQEFAGRTVGARKMHAAAVKRLEQVGGAKELLTRDELRALNPSNWLPGHLRPLAAMGERHGWANADTGILSRWLDTTTSWRENGMVPMIRNIDRQSMPKWLDDENNFARALLIGKKGSVREMALMGVDPDYVRAGELWMNQHADSIMRATSSMNSGMMEKAVVNPDSLYMSLPDPKTGKIEETLVVMSGERGRVAAGDIRYMNAVHHRVQEVFHDEIMKSIYSDAVTNYFPGFDEISLQNVAEALQGIAPADGYTSKMIVGEFLQPRPDNWSAVATSMQRNQGELAEVMRIAQANARGDVPTVVDFQQALREAIARHEAEALIKPEAIGALKKLDTQLEQMRPVLEGMDALAADARAWTSAVLSRQMASDHTAYDIRSVWRQAGGGEMASPPKNVYYRGVRDMQHVRINEDGSLTLLATEQEQWTAEHGAMAISLSTDPGQSMYYSTDRSIASQRLDSGVMFELDGDYLNGLFNTSLDELKANPSNFHNTRFDGDGLYMVGNQDGEFTEIALGLDTRAHGNIEVTIPAGHWRTSGQDDLRWISEQVQLGGTINTQQRYADAAANIIYDIKDQPVAEIFPKANQLIDEFVADLQPEEQAWLVELFHEQTTHFKGQQGLIGDPSYTGYDPVFDLDEMPGGSGDDLDRMLVKWRGLVDRKIQGDATVGDVLRHISKDQATMQFGPYALDDMIRERMGLQLMQGIDRSRPVNKLDNMRNRSSGNMLLTQGFSERGQGGWGSLEEIDGWAPFTTDFNQMQEQLTSNLTAALERPENTQYVKRADRILTGRDGETVARPVVDGEARVYTPIVPPRSKHIDEILDGIDLDLPDDSSLSIFRSVESALAVGTGQMPGFTRPLTGRQFAAQQVLWMTESDLTQPAGAISDARRAAAQKVNKLIYDGKDDGTWVIGEYFFPAWEEYQKTLEISQTMETKARKLLSHTRAWHYDDPIIRNMPEEEKLDLVVHALRAYDASRAKYGQDLSAAMAEIAVDDPRVAKWLSSLFSETGDQASKVGIVGLPRTALGGDVSGKFGVTLANEYTDAGRRWSLDARYHGNVRPVESDVFQVFDNGEVVPGISQSTAIRQWAEDTVESVLLNHRRGVREAQVYNAKGKTERVARKVGDQYQPLNEGERLDGPEDLFSVDVEGNVGKPVMFGDSSFFDHEVMDQSEELMLAAMMPMVRDVYEEEAGLVRMIANEYKEGGKFWGKKKALDVDQEVNQFVNMKRARVSDLGLEPSMALPNVAIAENYRRLPNTVWDRIVRNGFDKVIGPAIDSLARKPMSFHYFASAYKQQKRQLSWMLDDELFDVRVPEVFADLIHLGRAEGNLDQTTIDAARLVAKNFGTDMTGAGTNDIKRFLLSIGTDQGEFEAALDVSIAGARNRMAFNGSVKSKVDEEYLAAAEHVRDTVNRNALHLTLEDDVVGMRSDGERLVQAYHDAVPDGVWSEGRDAVLRYVEKYTDGLPFAINNEQWDALKAARTNLKYVNDEAAHVASLRAMENVIPFLDSHEQRTMFAEYGRNFLPFWYAEENFIKRWARTMSLGEFGLPGVKWTIPSGGLDAMRKAQLTYMGIKSAGIIRTDSNGHDWMVYPGSGLLTEAVAKILPGELEPVGVLFQADTASLLPGVTPDGNISPSPLVAMPVQLITHFFPEAQGVKQGILGDIGANRSIVSQFVPTVLNNMWETFMMDENSSTRYGSAMNAAIAMAEAEGTGLEEGASATQIDEYLDRMRNHARIILASQAFAGFFVPGSPNALATGDDGLMRTGMNVTDPREVTSEIYRGYIRNLGMDKGVEAFLAAFPQADLEDIVNPMAFSTSGTTAPSGAPLPATAIGMEWYDNNRKWVDQSPEAGAWLIPQPDAGEDVSFNRNAYTSQVVSGLRKRRSPQEYLSAIKYRQGADVYFRNKDKYDEAVIQTGGNQQAKAELEDRWNIWKGQFLAANVLFAEQLQSGDARVRRGRTIEQMRYAITDPLAPESPYKDGIGELVRSYDTFAAKRKILGDRSDAKSRAELRALKDAFSNWGTAWTLRHPAMGRLWESVYRIEAGIA